jgi:hypothetical protein
LPAAHLLLPKQKETTKQESLPKMKQTISLEQFHKALSECYAVCVNDTLYFIGYDDEIPYISDSAGEDRIDLDTIDGDIEIADCGVFFYVQEYPVHLKFLLIQHPVDFII